MHIHTSITQEIFSTYADITPPKKHSTLDSWPLPAEFLALDKKLLLSVLVR